MSDFLDNMAASSKARSAQAQTVCSLAEAQQRCLDLPLATPIKRAPTGMSVIAEIKIRSPAEGTLSETATTESVVARAARYVSGGASILSVLTEPERFDGSLDYLAAVKAHVGRRAAVMRKDFLTDVYQLYEARLHGADGVLLIARMLSDELLERMLHVARELDVFVLLEGFDQADLERMSPYASEHVLLGLNCRDLTTLKIDPSRFAEYAGRFPANAIKVAESGIHSVNDAVDIHAMGYDMALIGTMLMKTDDPASTIAGILSATGAYQK